VRDARASPDGRGRGRRSGVATVGSLGNSLLDQICRILTIARTGCRWAGPRDPRDWPVERRPRQDREPSERRDSLGGRRVPCPGAGSIPFSFFFLIQLDRICPGENQRSKIGSETYVSFHLIGTRSDLRAKTCSNSLYQSRGGTAAQCKHRSDLLNKQIDLKNFRGRTICRSINQKYSK
jgi:hypothetical protein